MQTIGVAIIGCGGITLQNHLPGLALCQDVKVTALCDADPGTLDRARQQTGVQTSSPDFQEIVKRDDVQAVIIATPNFLHPQIALAAVASGKHVLCEKPLALNYTDAKAMADAAEKAGVRHMTAFTYRFVPAMRYMSHLVKRGDIGKPYHFRAQRFQDWGDRNLGWRQVKKLAGTGELGDMLSHRIDYGHLLVGPVSRLVADTRRLVDDRQGAPSDLEDWVGVLAQYQTGASGVLESTKLATGRGEGHRGLDLAEVNGPGGTIVFSTQKPLQVLVGKPNGPDLEAVPVPREFLVVPGSPRDPAQGDPLATFRYDQDFEFVQAVRGGRPCRPSLWDGARAQAVMDAALQSAEQGRWVDVAKVGVEAKDER